MKETGGWRKQQSIVVLLIMGCVLVVLVAQIWLLTASLEVYLAGTRGIALPAFLASLACLAFNLYLLRYLYRLDRTLE